MRTTKLDKLLSELDACSEARDWAKGKSLSVAYETCKNAEWMMWLFGRMEGRQGWPKRPAIVLAACACARLALRHVPSGEDRPRLAIEAAEAWAKDPSEERRAAARDAAWAAGAAWDAAGAAGDAEHVKMCKLIRKILKPGKI